MPPLSARNLLCLFCALTAPSRPRLATKHFLPQFGTTTTTRSRVGTRKSKPRSNGASEYRKNSPYKPRIFSGAIQEQLGQLKKEIEQSELRESLRLTEEDFESEWGAFELSIDDHDKVLTENPTKDISRSRKEVLTRLRYLFYAHIYDSRFTTAELENQKEIANLRYPAEWYPATRQIQRTVHLHVGPTNSGKTYHALKRLEEADKGIYLGPLRLLAHEVYTRLNVKGKQCALVTGEEQRFPDGLDGAQPSMFSCTVEMAPLGTRFDVAVIDEIQMISHKDRGWAWTQAFLGLQAREIHLCGEARTVPLIRELSALVGDKVIVHEYQRLTPLQVEAKSLEGKMSNLQKGDCIVAFSVLGIHARRQEIEEQTGKKCAIVYGSLPPETRAQQARLFNDPDNDYDYLVASDAIGMGLNLAIRRVILETTFKNNGVTDVRLGTSEVKQIAGRAGRYKTAPQAGSEKKQNSIVDGAVDPVIDLDDQPEMESKKSEDTTVGWVTTLYPAGHNYLQKNIDKEPPAITTAGLFPPSPIIDRFAKYFPPGTPFSYILLRLHKISVVHPRFFHCGLHDQLAIADVIDPIENLSIHERITICAAPMNMRNPWEQRFVREVAQCIADAKSGNLLNLKTLILDIMDQMPCGDRKYLKALEQLHRRLVCYLWLSYRFPNVFTTRALADHAKKLVETQIENTLIGFSFFEQARQRWNQRQWKQRQYKKSEEMEEDAEAEAVAEGPLKSNA